MLKDFLKYREEFTRFLITIIGLVILGSAINIFSWKYKLISGGLPGYALITNYLTGMSVGTFLIIGNTIILLLSIIIAGKTAGLRGVFGYTFLALFIDFEKKLLDLTQTEIISFSSNAMLLSLQGFIAPIGIALVITHGYSFGSYSSILPIIYKYKKIPPPIIFWIFDFILAVTTFFFFSFQRAILLFLNATIFFFTFKYSLKLISKSPFRISFNK